MQSKQPVQANKANHICKLKRHTYETGNKIYFCTLPKCNKKIKIGLALGKECICWRCGEVFILNEYSIRLAKPHCTDCHNSKDKSDVVVEFKFEPENSVIPINDIETVKQLANIGIPPTSLSDRLKKAVSIEIKQEDESDEEL